MKMMSFHKLMRRLAGATAGLSLAFSLAVSGAVSSAQASDIEVSDVWARASAGMAMAGAAFMRLENRGIEDDALIAAEADVSKKVELHTHIMDQGVMRMRRVMSIPIPAGQSTMLKPGGLHVMFMGLRGPFIEGASFPLTLRFANAGTKTVLVHVQGAGAMGKMDPAHMQHQ